MGQLANLHLGQAHFVEGTSNANLARRLPAGTVVAAIVGIAAIHHHRESAIGSDAGQRRVELVLTEVTAICRVGPVLGAKIGRASCRERGWIAVVAVGGTREVEGEKTRVGERAR